MTKFKVTGNSGISEVIEASDYLSANRQFMDHHGEPAKLTEVAPDRGTTNHAYINETDTYGD